MTHESLLPREIDLLIVGGGTTGAALAGIVVRDTGLNVVLLEAGPDYGSLSAGRWPEDLLDARRIPHSHDWGYSGLAHASHSDPTSFDRARVIGGCSSHNGCVALLGHRRDYDHWAELGNEGWDWESVKPAFARAIQSLRVRQPDEIELTPFQAGFVTGSVANGIPKVDDLNDPDEPTGVSPSPVNIYDGTRWNTSLAYLDPVRERPNLTVIGNALVDQVEVRAGRAEAIHAVIAGEPVRIAARRIVLAAGAYGSPAIMLRSGIGEPDDLRELGIDPVHPLPGVGRALADHPATELIYRGSPVVDEQMAAFERSHWLPDEQALAKTRSSLCREAFDLHLYAVSGRDRRTESWFYHLSVAVMNPLSSGKVMLASRDPEAMPLIDHGYLTDPEGHDAAVLAEGVELAREIIDASPLAGQLQADERLAVGPDGRADVQNFVQRAVGIYYHPACSCRMGPASDPQAVVDAQGKVHGLNGLYVCDASIFPQIMRANTNLPAAMLAEHLAESLATFA